MLNDNSSAIASVAATSRRTEISPGNSQGNNAAGAIPAGNSGEARQEGYLPVRVEQSGNSEDSATSFERYVRPPYVPVFVTSAFPASEEKAEAAAEDAEGLVAAVSTQVEQENTEEINAEAAAQANEQTVQSVSDTVKQLYDLPE
jgi:hypothetical protein